MQRKVFWGVAQPLPQETEQQMMTAQYLNGDTETMTLEVVCQYMAYSWDEVPKRHRFRLTQLARQKLPSTPVAQRSTELRAPGTSIVCKRFNGRAYFGVATYNPQASPPFVYEVNYEDDDSENMTSAEVLRHMLPPNSDIPQQTAARLAELGAPVPAPRGGQPLTTS
jgi:hypothetical protein